MPCNAISMRTADVKVDAILKTTQGLEILTKLVENQFGITVSSPVDLMHAQVKKGGYCWMQTNIGSFRFWIDKDVEFPDYLSEDKIDAFIKQYTKVAGKVQQKVIEAMIIKKLGKNYTREVVKGNIILRGELSI